MPVEFIPKPSKDPGALARKQIFVWKCPDGHINILYQEECDQCDRDWRNCDVYNKWREKIGRMNYNGETGLRLKLTYKDIEWPAWNPNTQRIW